MCCATITIDDPHGTITITRVRVAGYTRRDGRNLELHRADVFETDAEISDDLLQGWIPNDGSP